MVLADRDGKVTDSIYAMTIDTGSQTATDADASATNGYLPSGNYYPRCYNDNNGFMLLDNSIDATISVPWLTTPTITQNVISSYVGGKIISISGNGFVEDNIQNNQLYICGNRAEIISASATTLSAKVPTLVTAQTQSQYNLRPVGVISGTPISDDSTGGPIAFDGSLNTVYRSTNSACYVGVDFG